MNTNITKMNIGKSEKTLNKLVVFEDVVMTKKQWLNKLFERSYKPEIGSTCPIKYDRVKYNRMSSHKEQQDYEKRLSETVTEYRAKSLSGSYSVLSKTEYDYLDSLCCPDASEAELNHLFGIN